MNPATIELLPASAARDQLLVDQLTDLINLVFAEAEAGMWVEGARRTTPTEIEEMIAARQFALARVDGLPAGCVRVRQLDASAGELGMVAGHPGRRGARIDCDLIRFAEELSVERGLSVMQAGLLLPRGRSDRTEVSRHQWFTRLGYRPVRTGVLAEHHPQLARLLAHPCDFVVYRKPLAVLRSTPCRQSSPSARRWCS